MFVIHHECDGLDEHGVLRPGLQVGQQNSGVRVLVQPQLHIHHVPAVGAAAVLPLKLCDVLEWPAERAIQIDQLLTFCQFTFIKIKILSCINF